MKERITAKGASKEEVEGAADNASRGGDNVNHHHKAHFHNQPLILTITALGIASPTHAVDHG